MTQRKPTLKASEIQKQADAYLHEIAVRKADIEALQAECEAATREISAGYALRIEARNILLKSAVLALIQTMKQNKAVLFDDTDVVNLDHGSLIHNVADHVTIPKSALAACEQQGFNEAIKIAKSLDRDAIEKWPDAKLALIGAERKKKEDYSYTLKEGK